MIRKGRLEAFSDGVIAIIITIMVLELKVPHDTSFAALSHVAPVFVAYVLSFLYVAIYWHNHHHLLNMTKRIDGTVMWANTHLLFWLSMTPFATGWMSENEIATAPVVLYGFVLFMSGIAYFFLQSRIVVLNGGAQSHLARALGRDLKGMSSPVIYIVAIGCAFLNPWIAFGLYFLVAMMWLIPDRRLERMFDEIEAEVEGK
jgi:uncharacterized membrane protein